MTLLLSIPPSLLIRLFVPVNVRDAARAESQPVGFCRSLGDRWSDAASMIGGALTATAMQSAHVQVLACWKKLICNPLVCETESVTCEAEKYAAR
jgi:hypothetical protein